MTKGQFIRIGFVIFLELIVAVPLVAFYYFDSLLSFIFTFAASGVSLFLVLILVIIDLVKYSRTKSRADLKPAYAALIIAIIFGIPVLVIHCQKLSPSILYCSGDDLQNEINVNLRKNGTCEIICYGLGSVTSRCNYQRHDSVIEIKKNYFDSLIISNYLVVRPIGKEAGPGDSLILYQVDDRLKRIPSSTSFIVHSRKPLGKR